METGGSFIFCTERRLVKLTGRRAHTLAELRTHLREVTGASIFYHTHHLYLSHHFERPPFFNDFAIWTSGALLERALGEQLAAVDLLEFTTIRKLRERIIDIIENHLATSGDGNRHAPAGEEFHFCESQSFIMPTGLVAADVREFFQQIPHLTTVSLFYHFIEARLRIGQATNDFSVWLMDRGETGLAQRIAALNPYLMSLDQLRMKLTRMGKSYQEAEDACRAS